MISLENAIGELLLRHNCVVIPNFGGFIAQRSSAQLDLENGVITPPKKAVLFNRQLMNNDGLLVAHIAIMNKINFQESADYIQSQVSLWENRIKNRERLAIDKVGFLYQDMEGNLCFEQDKFYNLLLDSFGLINVRFVSKEDAIAAVKSFENTDSIETKTRENTLAFVKKDVDDVTTTNDKDYSPLKSVPLPSKKANRNWLHYAAAAAFLPIAFYSFWIPVKTDAIQRGSLLLADFNPFTSHVVEKPKLEKKKKEEKTIDTSENQITKDTYVPSVEDSPVVENPIIEQNVEDLPSVPAKVESKKGILIVGSFSTRANAEERVALLAKEGVSAEIIEKDGRIRVSAGSADKLSSIQSALDKLGIDPWTLK